LEEYLAWLAEQAVAADSMPPTATVDSWEKEWRTWASSHESLPARADDDREGIYAGRGE
jgi:hypothetical protein